MAPKRPAPADEQPPPAESSDEETSSGSTRSEEEENEESSESDGPKGTQPKVPLNKPSSAPPPRANSKPQGSPRSSESESESKSESEPDEPKGKTLKTSRPTADANPKSQKSDTSSESESESDVTPLAAKPMEGQTTPQSNKLNLKRPGSELTVAAEDAAKTPSKKPSNATSRSSQNTGEESSKKPLFQRVWSDEDEITLLEGMIEYWEKRGVDPAANINSFHAFIKERLQLDAVPGQLVTKMRNSKKKFKNNEAKVKNGKEKIFTKPNEQRAFELCRKLWGSEEGIMRETSNSKPSVNGSASKKKKSAQNTSSAVLVPHLPQYNIKNKDEKATEEFETKHSSATQVSLCEHELSRFSGGHVDARFLRRGLELISESKREELEERWKKLQLAELQALSERALMIHEQTNLIIDAYKKSGEQ